MLFSCGFMQTDIMLPFNWMANKESKLAAKFITYTHRPVRIPYANWDWGRSEFSLGPPTSIPEKGRMYEIQMLDHSWMFLLNSPTLLFGWESIFCNGKVRVINCFGCLNSHFITDFKELAMKINHFLVAF